MQIINLMLVLHVNVFSISHWFHKTICIRLNIQKVILYFYTGEMFSYALSFKYAICQPLLFVIFCFIFDSSQCLSSEGRDDHYLWEMR